MEKKECLFGTDGIRGTPGVYPLTDGMIFKIGRSAGRYLYYRRKDERKQMKVVIGKDTRLTGDKIETLLSNAFTSYGAACRNHPDTRSVLFDKGIKGRYGDHDIRVSQ